MRPTQRVVLVGGYAGDGWLSVRRYGKELLAALRARAPDTGLDVGLFSLQPDAFAGILLRLGPPGRRAASYWTRFRSAPRQIPSPPGAIHHLLDQSLSFLVRSLNPERTVATCHDLLHFPLWERRRRHSPWPWATDRLYRYCVGALPRCAAILAVSQRTKEDAVRYLGCDPKRVYVVHEGVSRIFREPPPPQRLEEVRRRFGLREGPFLLHVGVAAFYKNLEGLLSALALLRRKHRVPATLLRVGPPLNSRQRRLARRLGTLEGIRELGLQEDETLACLYRLSDLLVQPSLYEGFGLPPIEAMACGLPVVASDRGALPEILAEAALFVNPEEPGEIAGGIRRVLQDTALREDLRRRGLARSQRFRWEETARGTLEVYGKLMGKS